MKRLIDFWLSQWHNREEDSSLPQGQSSNCRKRHIRVQKGKHGRIHTHRQAHTHTCLWVLVSLSELVIYSRHGYCVESSNQELKQKGGLSLNRNGTENALDPFAKAPNLLSELVLG